MFIRKSKRYIDCCTAVIEKQVNKYARVNDVIGYYRKIVGDSLQNVSVQDLIEFRDNPASILTYYASELEAARDHLEFLKLNEVNVSRPDFTIYDVQDMRLSDYDNLEQMLLDWAPQAYGIYLRTKQRVSYIMFKIAMIRVSSCQY
jgi:hypothetical protein